MRCRDRTVPLIGAKVRQLRAERIAPDDGIAAVARMTEIEGIRHFRNVAADEFRISAEPVARQDQRIASDAFAGAVVMNDFDATDTTRRIRENPLGDAAREDDDTVFVSGLAQAIDQFLAASARQAMHAHGRVTRIIEVVDHIKRHPIPVGQPFNQLPCALCHAFDDSRIGFVHCFVLYIGSELRRAIVDTPGALETRAGRRNEARRQSRRTGRHCVALNHHRADARLLRGERGA